MKSEAFGSFFAPCLGIMALDMLPSQDEDEDDVISSDEEGEHDARKTRS